MIVGHSHQALESTHPSLVVREGMSAMTSLWKGVVSVRI
jgi:hypothetical protein